MDWPLSLACFQQDTQVDLVPLLLLVLLVFNRGLILPYSEEELEETLSLACFQLNGIKNGLGDVAGTS